MKEKVKKILDYSALTYLGIVFALCLFPHFILGLLGLDIDVHLKAGSQSPAWNVTEVFGRDNLGRSILAMMINGAKFSLAISIFSATLATAIGVFLGAFSGFFGDNALKVTLGNCLLLILLVPINFYYIGLATNLDALEGVLLVSGCLLLSLLVWWLVDTACRKLSIFQRKMSVPVDFVQMKFVEILYAIPTYFVLLALAGIFKPSVQSLIVIIGITSWPMTALLLRTEMLKVREMDFVHALKLAGVPWYRILFRHAIPNAISPVVVDFLFFASGLLVIESTLSFIGIGLPGEIISWGKILASFKHNSASWWTALFPGIILFLTVLSFHRVGRMVKVKYSFTSH